MSIIFRNYMDALAGHNYSQPPISPCEAFHSDQAMETLVNYLSIIFVGDLDHCKSDELIKNLLVSVQNDPMLSWTEKKLFVERTYCKVIDEYNFPEETKVVFHRSIDDLLEAIDSLSKNDAVSFKELSDIGSWPVREREDFIREQSDNLLRCFQTSIDAKNAVPLLFSIFCIGGLDNLTAASRQQLRMELASSTLDRMFPHHGIDAKEKSTFDAIISIAPSFFSLFEAGKNHEVPSFGPKPYQCSGCSVM